jgi:hypothetical protein
MYEVITLHNPFEGKEHNEIESELKNGKYPKIENKELYKLYDIEMINIVNEMLTVCLFNYIILFVYLK